MIYLDNAATTKPYKEVAELINRINENEYFNPSALYGKGSDAKATIEKSRAEIAELLGVTSAEIYFTSGATEADNWAISSGFKNKKGNIVISAGEHSAIYESALNLKNKGFEVRFSPLNADGAVNKEKFAQLVDENTSLVSVIHYSNETGAINDIFALSKLCKAKNKKILFHSDGVQAFCKNKTVLKYSDVDLYSISAHKVGGVKGCGALYIKKGVNLSPLIFGGGQESNMRSGTENVAAIGTFGIAAKSYYNDYDESKMRILKDTFLNTINNAVTDYKVNSNINNACSAIISISFAGLNAEVLQRLSAAENIFIGLGSACASKLRSNRVLGETGLSQKDIAGSVRISFSPQNTADEIKRAAVVISEKIKTLRSGQVG